MMVIRVRMRTQSFYEDKAVSEFAMILNVFRWVHKSRSLYIDYNAKKELYYFTMVTRYYMLKIPSTILRYVISWSWSVVGDGYHEDDELAFYEYIMMWFWL